LTLAGGDAVRPSHAAACGSNRPTIILYRMPVASLLRRSVISPYYAWGASYIVFAFIFSIRRWCPVIRVLVLGCLVWDHDAAHLLLCLRVSGPQPFPVSFHYVLAGSIVLVSPPAVRACRRTPTPCTSAVVDQHRHVVPRPLPPSYHFPTL